MPNTMSWTLQTINKCRGDVSFCDHRCCCCCFLRINACRCCGCRGWVDWSGGRGAPSTHQLAPHHLSIVARPPPPACSHPTIFYHPTLCCHPTTCFLLFSSTAPSTLTTTLPTLSPLWKYLRASGSSAKLKVRPTRGGGRWRADRSSYSLEGRKGGPQGASPIVSHVFLVALKYLRTSGGSVQLKVLARVKGSRHTV